MLQSIIGIDFGTSYSCASVYDRNSFHILENLGDKKTLNYVAFKENGREIGEAVKNKIRINYNKVLFDSKIFLGKGFGEIIQNKPRFPFEFVNDEQNRLNLKLNEKVFAPEEIVAIFLKKMKELAQNHLNKEVKDAVITVPASFNDSQRQALKDAAKIAGLNCIKLLNDTTAAAIAYSHDKNIDNKKNILIFDLGAYYLNLALVSIEYGVVNVKKSMSFPESGGTIFDRNMVQYLMEKSNINYLNSKAIQTLLVNCEKAKKNLSNGLETQIEIESFITDQDEDTSIILKREEFELINKNLLYSIRKNVHLFLKEVNVSKNEVEEILLFGGSSRIPMLQEMLRAHFVDKPLNISMNASESVAYGAGIQAAFLSGCALNNKNGFKYFETSCFNYKLDIATNPFQIPIHNPIPYCELTIGTSDLLPTSKNVVLNRKFEKTKFFIDLYQNDLKIKHGFIFGENIDKLDVSMRIDLNGNIIVKADYTSDGQPMVTCLNNLLNLKEEKINFIIQSNVYYEKHQQELKKHMEIKNHYEQKLINFKTKLNGFENAKTISAMTDVYLDDIRSNKISNFNLLDTELNNLENEFNQLKNIRNNCLCLKKIVDELIQRHSKFAQERCLKIQKKLDDLTNSDDQIDKLVKELEITKNEIQSTQRQISCEANFNFLINELSKVKKVDTKIADANNNINDDYEKVNNELSDISILLKSETCDNYEIIDEKLKSIKHKIFKLKLENGYKADRADNVEKPGIFRGVLKKFSKQN